MQTTPNRPSRVLQIAVLFLLVAFAASAHADIFQWEYINPADPSQGKRQSTMLAPDGAGVDAGPRADLSYRNLTMAYLIGADLSGAFGFRPNLSDADLSQANLTNASFYGATLTGADFTGAAVLGTNLARGVVPGDTCGTGSCGVPVGTGITLAQLYSTASYEIHDLRGISLWGDFTGGNFTSQNLSNASLFAATLTEADFAGAEVRGANFQSTSITYAQLYSTASYQAHDLTGIGLAYHDLSDWNFAGQNLTNASVSHATLTDADFTGAQVRGATFARGSFFDRPPGTGISIAQLYSTASYQARDLRGVNFTNNNLAGGIFADQYLTSAFFYGATLTAADFSQANLSSAQFAIASLTDASFRRANLTNATFVVGCLFPQAPCSPEYANVTGADLTAADSRGAIGLRYLDAITTNLIRPDGHVSGLDLDAGGLFVVRDYDGNPNRLDFYGNPLPPIPITIDQHLAMGPGGTLRILFEADAWDSTISFAPGIPVSLGGTLELTFTDDVNLAAQVGRTFDLFDWNGVSPTGAFAIASPYAWDLSNLYTTGQVTLTAVPEPTSLLIAAMAAAGWFWRKQRAS